jgi:hypothetical protein
MAQRATGTHDNERLGTLFPRGLEGLFQLFGALDGQGVDTHPLHAGSGFDFVEIRHRRGDVVRREVADPREVGEGLFQQLQAFAGELLHDVDDAGDIAARACQAGDESEPHGIIAGIQHDARDGARRLFGGERPEGAADREAVDLELDHLFDERRKPFDLAVRKARLDNEILACRIAQFLEALCERLVPSGGRGGRAGPDIPDPIHLGHRLRVSGMGHHKEDKGDEESERMKPHGRVLESV